LTVRQCPILMYHWFRREGSPSASRSPQLEITPELFERQVRYLHEAGYRSISLDDALDRQRSSPRSVVLTFDDGTEDFWRYARPVLLRYGFTATLFVVTGHVGGRSTWDEALGEPARDLLSWDQLRSLRDEGFEIGSHTQTHRVLLDLDSAQVGQELRGSAETLEKELGQAPAFLAYPRGFYRSEHKKMARDAGYRGACAVILGWGDLRAADPYALKRMTIKGTEGMARFRARLRLARSVRLEALR